jgi:cytochrome c oxidase subunit 3
VAANLTGPVAHHFNNLGQQQATVRMGMWLFLVTEVLFFGGAFCAYTVYRLMYPKDFEAGSAALNVGIASINTFLLLASSLTITLAIRACYVRSRKGLARYLLATIVLGSAFLGLKAREYYLDYEEGLIPNVSKLTPAAQAAFDSRMTALAAQGQKLAADAAAMTGDARLVALDRAADLKARAALPPVAFNENLKVALGHNHAFKGKPLDEQGYGSQSGADDYDPQRVQLFFMFYYSMTGLHVLHMIIGLGLLAWQYVLTARGFFDHNSRYVYIEVMSLYWHFVDMAWMFILPLLYLTGPHSAGHAVEQFKQAIGMATGGH